MEDEKRYVKRSVSLTKDMMQTLDTISAGLHIPTSELIRKYIDQGLNVDKTKSDIDFIRKNVREEVEIIMNKHTNRTLSLLYKIGMYVIPQSLFTAEIVHKIFRLKDDDKADFAEMWNVQKMTRQRFCNQEM